MKERLVGDLRLGRVFETMLPLGALDFFPDTTDHDWAPHQGWLTEQGGYDPASRQVLLPVQSYLVWTTHHTILVDACFGNDKDRPGRPWHQRSDSTYLDNLAAHGVNADDVDYVMCTHLHGDHVGWNTKLVDGRWVPTFPNARYLFSETEVEAARAAETLDPALVDSVLPVVEAGQGELVSGDHGIDDEVWLEPTPGHTRGHFAVRLASNGEQAVIGGDLMHSPVKCHHPEWRAMPDWDPDLARRTRRSFMERHHENNTLVAMAHFPLPSDGRFVTDGDQFRFEYDTEDW